MQTLVKGINHKAKVSNQRYIKVALFIDGDASDILELIRPILNSKMTKSIDADARLKKAINDDLSDTEKSAIKRKYRDKK